MATRTDIGWVRNPDGTPGMTWNIVIGCDKVSEGCDGCYAIGQAHMRAAHPHPKVAAAFAGLTHRTDDGVDWTGRVNILYDRLSLPFGWRKRRGVFLNSLADLFHPDVPEWFIVQAFAVMAVTGRHTYTILTKRPARMRSILSRRDFWETVGRQARDYSYATPGAQNHLPDGRPVDNLDTWSNLDRLPNVWLGVSVENQYWADIRVPQLLHTPGALRFLSCEPLLGPIDLKQAVITMGSERGHGLTASYVHWGCCERFHGLDWVIVGGESGSGARPMHPDWARSLRDQCRERVPYFFKQWGAWGPAPYIVPVGDPAAGWRGGAGELQEARKASEAAGATHVHTSNPYLQGKKATYHVHEIDTKPWSPERRGLPEGMEAIRRWGTGKAGNLLDGELWEQLPPFPVEVSCG